jgi:hypothetical protein
MRAALDELDEGEFTEGHELDRKWKVAKEMVGRRLSQAKFNGVEVARSSPLLTHQNEPTCRNCRYFLYRSQIAIRIGSGSLEIA